MPKTDFDVAVIGAGPAGLVSTLYLGRYLRKVAMVSFGAPRASWIPRTYNLLGYRGGISGAELLSRLHRQIDECGSTRVEKFFGESAIKKQSGGFLISAPDFEFSARKVILATGMTDVQPAIDNMDRLRRRGLLRYCPVCDAFEYRNKKIIVLAQDLHGLKSAEFLFRFTKHVQVLWPRGEALPKGASKLKFKVPVIKGQLLAISEENSSGRRASVGYQDEEDRERWLKVDAVYVALGVKVNDSAFRSFDRKLQRTEDGYLIANSHQELPVSGLYAAGDCVEGLAQIAVAAGQAAVAATAIHNRLRQENA